MPATSFVGASYPAELSWNPILSAADSEDPAALISYRILPLSVGIKQNPRTTTKTDALMIELQYRHGTLKRQLILKNRFRGAASLEKKGRNEVAINYLASDDPTQRELTEHIYFETPLDALDFQMRLTGCL